LDIKTVSIVGLGALGVMFGNHLSAAMPRDDLRIVADGARIERYRHNQIYCNGIPCDFNFLASDENCSPADLLIFSVKFNDLPQAIKAAKNQVGSETIILSLLNGISSERIIARTFGAEKVLYSTAQGMDAVKVGNRLEYQHMGTICFGTGGKRDEKVDAVARFFDKTALPYEAAEDMHRRMWGKFMLNVGVNQSAAVFGCGYGGLQTEGSARDTMIAAMREVVVLSERENIGLTEADIDYWLGILAGLNPLGKPSMQQDLEAGRRSEVGLFSGTVLELGEKHGLSFPVNRMLYDKIHAAESGFRPAIT